ncbi:MAG: DUF167 domain-containing protein [Pyrinomonadaceae bacterium]
MINFTEKNGAVIFTIRVVPRASKSEIVGEVEGNLKVRISAPPVDGAANDEVVRVLAKAFGVAKSNVVIVAGQTSKTKRIRITGVTAAQLQKILGG